MKKFVAFAAVIAAVSFASCNSQAKTEEAADSTAMDSATLVEDAVPVVDTAAMQIDSAPMKAEEATEQAAQ